MDAKCTQISFTCQHVFFKPNFQSAISIPFFLMRFSLHLTSVNSAWILNTQFYRYTYFQSMLVYDHQKCSNSLLKCKSPIRNSIFSSYNFATKIQFFSHMANIFYRFVPFFSSFIFVSSITAVNVYIQTIEIALPCANNWCSTNVKI